MTHRDEFEALAPYLNQLKGTPVLTREAELVLTRRLKQGDMAARDELVGCNLPFVITVARKYVGRGARLDDLVQMGNLGLLQATRSFEPDVGTRFLSYAVWWIRAYVLRYRSSNRSEVRGGEKQRTSLHDVCLEAMVGSDEGSAVEQLMVTTPSAEEQYLERERVLEVRAAVALARPRLDQLRWEIVQERLTQDRPTSLKVLGKRRGMNGERVRQVEVRTKALLRCCLAGVS